MSQFSIGQSVASRAVHVKIHPRPRNLFERRRVLQKLKEFGEVDIFRMLPHRSYDETDEPTILTVFRHQDSAFDFLSRSPLQFEIGQPDQRPVGLLGLNALHAHRDQHAAMPMATSSERPLSEEGESAIAESGVQTFRMVASRSTFDHYGFVRRQPLYWDFKPSNNSSAEEHLKRSVPIRSLATITKPQSEIAQRIVNQKMEALQNRKSTLQIFED